ncbi:hypothetical protein CBW65_04735 [Tumebacillus avium]|uniref:Uncharacterized protein n=1 Tax=Tumebacillus avium TaxID=1903704 RepID=A0A1Y0IM73_9BACL|nr:endospore germination permease [Tumebacillus avium]ARU60453.1 hypothetical protein CBW65_04735 [Tumebacillus avium]
MNKQAKGDLGARGLYAMIVLVVGGKISDSTPTLVFKAAQNSTWMLPLLSILLLGPCMLILLSVMGKFPGKGLYEILRVLTGKYLAFLISLVVLAFMMANLSFTGRMYADIIETMFFPSISLIVIYLAIFVGVLFVARGGIERIGRTSWITLPYIKAAVLVLFLLSLEDTQWQRLFPILGPGGWDLVKQSVFHSSLYGELMMFIMLLPMAGSERAFRKGAYLATGFVVVELMLFFSLYIVLYDIPSVEMMNYPFQQLTRYVSLGRYFTNMEAVFLAFWIVATLLKLAFLLYVNAHFLSQVLRHEAGWRPLLLPITVLSITIGMIPKNSLENALIYWDNYVVHTSWPLLILLPCILWILTKVRQKGEGEAS